MNKLKYTLAVIATVFCAGTAQAQSLESCLKAGELVGLIVNLRDVGIPQYETTKTLIEAGLPDDTSDMVTSFVYETHKMKAEEEVQEIFLKGCLE